MNDKLFWNTNVVIYYATNAAEKLLVLWEMYREQCAFLVLIRKMESGCK